MIPRNKRALSPVISAIILIAVTVAVAIAATTWLGSMTFSFMSIEEFKITNCQWAQDVSYVDLTVNNIGTETVTIDIVKVNGVSVNNASIIEGSETLIAGEIAVFRIIQSYTSSVNYEFTIITTAGARVQYMSRAPYPTVSSTIWYNSSWSKRKMLTIDNTLNLDELKNFQIMFDIQYDSDMNSDFSDLRFTESDAQTLVPYWVESYVPSVSATVWVCVPFISASSTETIYMYYGNPSANTESNPDATFDLFINFTRDGVTSYGGSQDSNPSQWQILSDTVLRMWGNNWKATMKTLNVVGYGSQAIRFDFKSNGTQAEINGIGVDTDNSISSNRFYRIYGTQNWGINDHYGYTGAGDWESYSLILDNFSGDYNRFVFTNDADSGQSTNIYYRNVRVSQYTQQEPSIEFSTEENFN